MGLPQPTIQYNPTSAGPLDQLAKVTQLRNMTQQGQLQQQQIKADQLENQQRETALRDQQTVMQVLGQNGGDIGASLPQLAGKVTPQTYMGLAKAHFETREAALKMSNEQLANDKTRNDNLLGLIDQVKQIPPDQYAQQWPQIAQQAVKIKPELQGQIDPAKPIPQEQLGQMQLGIQAHSTIQAQVMKEREDKRAQQAADAELPGKQADSEMKVSEAAMMKQYGAMKPEMRDSKYIALQQQKALGQPISAGDQAFMKGYEKQKTLNAQTTFNLQNAGATGTPNQPSPIAQAIANGTMKWQDAISPRTPMSVKNQMAQEVLKLNPNFDTSTFAIEQKAAEKATSGTWADTRVAYNTAIDHASQLLAAADALKNGDVKKLNSLENYFKTEFGSPDVSNFNAIANAYNHEVTGVIAKGHITDAEVAAGHATLPDNASKEQIRGVAAAYKQLMMSKRDELDKVIKAGAGNKANGVLGVQSNGDKSGAEVSATGPNGHKIVVRGGRWVDAQSGQPIQ